jgi:hypothetical protein
MRVTIANSQRPLDQGFGTGIDDGLGARRLGEAAQRLNSLRPLAARDSTSAT